MRRGGPLRNALARADGRRRQGTSGGGSLPEDTQWYYIDAQQNYVGPVDSHGLRQLRLHKYVHADTYVWAERLAGWQKLQTLADFQEAAAAAPAAPPPPHFQPPAPAPLPPTPAPTSFAAATPAAPVLPAGTRAASSASTAAPLLPSGRVGGASLAGGGASLAGLSMGGGAVAAPPSLGMAAARRRQVTNEGGVPGAGGGLGGLAAGAGRPAGLGGLAGGGAAPLPLGSYRGGGLASLDGAPLSGMGSTPENPAGAGGAAAAAAVAAAASSHGPPSIPVPMMVPLEYSQGDWDSGCGMRLRTHDRMVRMVISEDGEVKDGTGATLAFIEANGEVGDAGFTYVGKAHHGASQVVDANDVVVGDFDSGRGFVKDAQGSVVAEISKEGHVTNNGGQGIGAIDGFSFALIGTLAAYFLLVDPAFVRTVSVSVS